MGQVCGKLITHSAPSRFSRAVLVATLVDTRRSEEERYRVPPLYCVELLAIATLAFRLRGFEVLGRGDDAQVVLQEWLCAYAADDRSSSG